MRKRSRLGVRCPRVGTDWGATQESGAGGPGSDCMAGLVRSATRALAAAAAVAIGLTACGSADTASDVATGASTAGSPPLTAEHPLSFQSSTTDGDLFVASELEGQDVVLWFWAPWCTICRSEAPEVLAAAEALADDVVLVGVASSGTTKQMQAFVAETGTSAITHVADVPGDVWRQFGIVAQPTFVFIDDDGRTQTFAGALGEAALIDAMRQLAAA